jgi:hypothetical protein
LSADLKVDYDLLTESSRSLQHIYQAFDGLKNRSSTTSGDWGSSAIAGAMGDFSGDWDNHREKIMKSVQTVKELTDQAVEAFRDSDGQLATSLEKATHKPGGAK